MSTLTDRYVWAVVCTAPEKQRPELEREVRALVADATDARLEAGSVTAEHDALVELGDPRVLAARYADRPLHLIGPHYYLVWQRLLKLLLLIVVPLASLGIGIGQFVAQADPGAIVGAVIGGAINVGVNICFWVTLVFAIIDRTDALRDQPLPVWTPEQLPELPASSQRSSLSELIASVVFLSALLIALVWQQFNPFLTDGGDPVPVLNPALWSFWIPWFIGLALAEIAFAVAVYLRGWGYGLAALNVLLNVAFVVPAVWLFVLGDLINPAFLAVLDDVTAGDFAEGWRIASIVIVIVFIAVSAWDIVDGFLRAYRARNPLLVSAR